MILKEIRYVREQWKTTSNLMKKILAVPAIIFLASLIKYPVATSLIVIVFFIALSMIPSKSNDN